MAASTPQSYSSKLAPLKTQVVSSADGSEPEISLTITLIDSPHPITVMPYYAPFRRLVNCLTVHNPRTGLPQQLPIAAVHQMGVPLPKLAQAMEDKFLTLRPEESHIVSESFRPFGHDLVTPEKIASTGMCRYKLVNFGMHHFQVGEEYSLSVQPGLEVWEWMRGDKDNLMVEEGDGEPWRCSDGPIEIVPGEDIRSRVEV